MKPQAVYVMQSGPQRHKIGRSCNVVLRGQQISNAIQTPVEVIFQTAPLRLADQVEAMAHLALATQHLGREWFDCSPDEAISAVADAVVRVEAGQWTSSRLAAGGGLKIYTPGMKARIGAALADGEDTVSFIRTAIESEIARRKRGSARRG